jgi:hypothetical protein
MGCVAYKGELVKQMLCFEVWKNDKRLAVAGVRETGVVSLVLSWVGKEPGASAAAATAHGAIPGLHWNVGGIDSSDPAGDKDVEWVDTPELKLGDEVRVRLISAESADQAARCENAVPASRVESGSRVIQCCFCGEMRQSESKGWLQPGVAGPDAFICARCLILAERLLNDGLQELSHLTHATDQACSFCGTEHSVECVTGGNAIMCRACVDMMMA